MVHEPLFERDISLSRRLLDDASKGMLAAETLLFQHSQADARLTAINFPLQESLLRETIGLLAGWQTTAAALLRRLDAATLSANLQFERLFDANAGRQTEGFLRRRVHLGPVAPEAIAAGLVSLLDVSAALDRLLRQAKPLLAERRHNCEVYLLQLVSRRQRIDADLVDVDRWLASLKASPQERQAMQTSWHSPASQAASEEERRTLALDRRTAQTRNETLRSELETLQRMIADDEDFVEALNAGIAAIDVMAAKLSLDIEQRVALLKAAQVQSSGAIAELPAPVQGLVDRFDANILAGRDLAARKQRGDEAFWRRFEAPLRSAEEPATDVDETGEGSQTPQAPI